MTGSRPGMSAIVAADGLVREVDARARRQRERHVVGLDDDAGDVAEPGVAVVAATQREAHSDAQVPGVGESAIDEHLAPGARQRVSGDHVETRRLVPGMSPSTSAVP